MTISTATRTGTRRPDTIENVSAASLQITADLVLTMLPRDERVYVLHKD
jgi:hypothetical protein